MTDAYLPLPPTARPLYEGGPDISPMAWGMWRFHGLTTPDARTLIDSALEAGITLFDTADIYGFNGTDRFGESEELLGRVLKDDPSLRSKLVLASKGGIIPGVPYDSSAEYLGTALDASLRRMGGDHIDLWQVHRPDVLTHPEELARTLENMVKSGKVGAIGVSNFTQPQIAALRAAIDIPITSSQPEYSPLHLDPFHDGQFDVAMQHGTHILAWSPLGGGRIANPQDASERMVANKLDEVAEAYGVSRTMAAFSWITAHPAHPIPIIGSQTASRIAEAADFAKIRWTRANWYSVLEASMGESLP